MIWPCDRKVGNVIIFCLLINLVSFFCCPENQCTIIKHEMRGLLEPFFICLGLKIITD
ncbi:hypothetical protein Leryth_009883, partial [Lithospermum erythrorhizon]